MIDAAMRKDTDLGLEERVARLGCWSAPVTMARLEGGLTNVSFRVQHRGEEFVARCGDDIPVHHIFRDRECAFIGAPSAGGSIHGMIVAQCQARLTRVRVKDLEAQLNCQEGDLSCVRE